MAPAMLICAQAHGPDMEKVRLHGGEEIERQTRPHPLSFLSSYFIAGFPSLLAIVLFLVYNSGPWNEPAQSWLARAVFGNIIAAYAYPLLALASVGVVAAVLRIRWGIFFGYIAVAAGALTLAALTAGWAPSGDAYTWTVPMMLFLFGLPLLLGAEVYRRSHRFTLTNLRIIFQGGVITRHERQLMYESITDLDGNQGWLGQLLGYGTIVAVTQSGFGIGADSSEAMMGVGVGAKKAGGGIGFGVAAGGGKEVNVGRSRSFHQLTGVRPYRDVKFHLESLIQQSSATPYLREGVDLKRKMLNRLDQMAHKGPDKGDLGSGRDWPRRPGPDSRR